MSRLALFIVFIGIILVKPSFGGVYEDILAAADNKRTEEVIDLLGRGLDVNTADRDGSTLLLIAVRTGNSALIDFLLKNRASVHKANRYGDTPSKVAAIQGHGQILLKLLDAGAEINPKGWSPLHYAVFGNHAELTSLLIYRGADVDQRAPNGRTALMLAAQLGHVEPVKRLLSAGADEELEGYDGLTAEDIAEKAGHKAIVILLRNAGQSEPE